MKNKRNLSPLPLRFLYVVLVLETFQEGHFYHGATSEVTYAPDV